VFRVTNVYEARLAQRPEVHFYAPDSPVWKMIRDEEYRDFLDLHSCFRKIGPGTLGFNTRHVFDVCNTDPEGLCHALVHGRNMGYGPEACGVPARFQPGEPA
jgi:hypothetical protein